MRLDPSDLPIPDRYKLLIGAIVPRPIAVVSTVSATGQLNLAPFSFFCGVGSNPMTLLFCPANDAQGNEKDTLRNAKPVAEGGTGQFVVNVAPASIIGRVVAAAEPLPPHESEFDLVGLSPVPSTLVHPPRVAESPIAFECRTLQVIRTNPGAPSGGNIVLGEVVSVWADDAIINERRHIDQQAIDLVGRMGGSAYCTTRQIFDLPMSRDAITLKAPARPQ